MMKTCEWCCDDFDGPGEFCCEKCADKFFKHVGDKGKHIIKERQRRVISAPEFDISDDTLNC